MSEQEEQDQLSVSLKVKEEIYNPATTAIQDVIVNNETSEITLKVVPTRATSKKVDFTLVDVPEGTTFESDDITYAKVTNEPKSLKITVPSTPKDYTFSLTKDGKTKKVTVHVVNVTMGGAFKVVKLHNESGLTSEVDSSVSAALEADGVNYTEPASDVASGSSNTANYEMNINKIAETTIENKLAKHFVVKIKLDKTYTFYDGDELIAINKNTGTKYTMVHSSTETNSYYVYLDSEEKGVDLVIANKNSTEEQIKGETNKVTINVKSTALLGIDAHNVQPKITSVSSQLPD